MNDASGVEHKTERLRKFIWNYRETLGTFYIPHSNSEAAKAATILLLGFWPW